MTPRRPGSRISPSHDQPFSQAGKQASRQAGKQASRQAGILLAVIALVFSASRAVAQQDPQLNPNAAQQQQGGAGIQITIDPPEGFLVEGPLPGNEENEEVHVIIPNPEHDFETEGNVPPAIITVEVTFEASPGRTLIQPAPAGGGNQATLAVPLERFEEASIPWEISPDASDPEDQPTGTVTLVYVTGRIVPADGQRGETGDMVDSIRGETGQRHYVSPRKPPSLPDGYEEHINMDDHLILQFEGISQTDFDQHLQWEIVDGLAEDDEAGTPTMLVSRGTAKHFPVRVLLKETGTPVALLNTWIVWVEITFHPDEMPRLLDSDIIALGARVTTYQEFMGEISPVEICFTFLDIPDLRGGPTTDPPEVGTNHFGDGDAFQRPIHNWHIARRMRSRAFAPTMNGTDLGYDPNAPAHNSFPTNGAEVIPLWTDAGGDGYPANPLLGNDTSRTNESVHADPYELLGGPAIIHDYDEPNVPAANSGGNLGDPFWKVIDFQAFARLELGQKWFLVSEYHPWMMFSHFTKRSEIADDKDYDEDGKKDSILWVPTLEGQFRSFIDTKNSNWPENP